MFKDIRLVIWDLDETFWRGTLTEGDIAYSQANHDIVAELNRRGIMSSICSRNDHDRVRSILEAHGAWDQFIFPSIDWEPKPARLQEIIDAVQLRPETILFIDDHAGNRGAAQAAIPGLNVADETIIPELLANPGLRGKHDPELSRLKQYKALELRHTAARRSGGDNADFLRESGITVEIIYDVEAHIDRAVELVNRTNQLNFTKRRLPADPEQARGRLAAEMAPFHAKAGLVSVRDKYGDYGICGFFLVHGLQCWGAPQLAHFAFSCRLLGMGVEQWVYDLLGRPQLAIAGDVRSDLSRPVDWINVGAGGGAADEAADRPFGEVRLRGGCELEVIEHFFKAHSTSLVTELVESRGELYMPRQNSAILAQALRGLGAAERNVLADLAMDPVAYQTRLFDSCADGTLIVYSPTADAMLKIKKHKTLAFQTAVWFREHMLPAAAARTEAQALEYDRLTAYLADQFDELPWEGMEKYVAIYREILERVPENALFVVMLPNCVYNVDGRAYEVERQKHLNGAFLEAGAGFANVRFVDMNGLLSSLDDVTDHNLHFNRAVYFRSFTAIRKLYAEWMDARPATAGEGRAPAEPPPRGSSACLTEVG
jgi:FkbH-like protein